MPRRVLVMTYEFPPAGGGGVQRWAKMCRYLPENGWEPIVVAAEPVPRRSRDESLLADVEGVEVHRIPHRHAANAIAGWIEPAKRLARRAHRGSGPAGSSTTAPAGSAASAQPSGGGIAKPPFSSRAARWLAVPDDAAFWRAFAVEEAVRVARASRCEAIIATGPPFSTMIAGAEAARRLGLPLVLDQRDGWQTNPVVKMPSRLHQRLSERLERRTMPVAEIVVATAPAIAEEAERFGARATRFIPNGFDPADIPEHRPDPGGPLRLAFMGKVYFGHSDPAPLFSAMARAAQTEAAGDVRLEIVGSWPESVERMARDLGVADRVDFVDYLPHHEALERTARADVGVLLIADRPGSEGSCPAKLYEYLGMGLPVLIVGPSNGLPAQVLSETRGGWVLHPDDVAALSSKLVELAESKRAGKKLGEPDEEAVARYSRRRQAARYAQLLDEITGGKQQ